MNPILLGDIAEKLAARNIVGDKFNVDFMEMLQYYPENDPDEFIIGWCATFVFHCCREVGFNLPLGTNKTALKGNFRWFTSVIAWVEWAQCMGYLYESRNFTPHRGDIVIYNNIISEEHKQKDALWCDHIGIVLSYENDTLRVAEGNVDNQNASGIMTRPFDESIGCFIRIPEDNIYDNWNIASGTNVTQTMNSSALFSSNGISFRIIQDTTEDKAQLLEWLSNPTVSQFYGAENAPWDMRKIELDFFSQIQKNSEETRCFIEINNEPIGYIQFYPIAKDSYPVTERFGGGYGIDLFIGYPGLWGKGIGTQVVRMMTDYLIHSLGAKFVCADPEEGNKVQSPAGRKLDLFLWVKPQIMMILKSGVS